MAVTDFVSLDEMTLALRNLKSVVARLRSPKGCPWDREQTHRSLIPFLREESEELAVALKKGLWHDFVKDQGYYNSIVNQAKSYKNKYPEGKVLLRVFDFWHSAKKYTDSKNILDDNGNRVGQWLYTKEK
jgi:NTP pyrophosphatase (non-canonical NTP hydrolase)